jgi:hypothetical protein
MINKMDIKICHRMDFASLQILLEPVQELPDGDIIREVSSRKRGDETCGKHMAAI